MTGTFKVIEPGKVEFELTLKMELDSWIALANIVEDKWPGYDFRRLIQDMVRQAKESFYPKEP
jgi:hypothetical protein